MINEFSTLWFDDKEYNKSDKQSKSVFCFVTCKPPYCHPKPTKIYENATSKKHPSITIKSGSSRVDLQLQLLMVGLIRWSGHLYYVKVSSFALNFTSRPFR